MTDRFHDYIQNLPMQIGRKFLPPPQINLPKLPLLRLNENGLSYNFEKELLARREYANSLKVTELEDSAHSSASDDSKMDSIPTTSTAGLFYTNEVLQPSKLEPPYGEASTNDLYVKVSNFDDLEGRASNIFDDLELKTIDDRAVLSQVLSKIQINPLAEANLSNLPKKEVVNISTNGVTFSTTEASSYNNKGETCPGRDVKTSERYQTCISNIPPPIPLHQISILSGLPSSENSTAENPAIRQLRTRLLTKGYKENIVGIALNRLPRERIQLIEYYMKSMRSLEKVGVDPGETLDFLVDCCLDDKQKIMDYGTVAAQFVQMGFTSRQCFSAIKTKSGDKVGALEVLLAQTR